MRPESLFSLFKPVDTLAGVGPRLKAAIERLAGPHVVDLLWHLPTGIIDRRYAPKIGEATPGRVATIAFRVDRHRKPPNRRMPYKVFGSDDSGDLTWEMRQRCVEWAILKSKYSSLGKVTAAFDGPTMTYRDRTMEENIAWSQ